MSNTAKFHQILNDFRKNATSQQDKGAKFERLMQCYLQTDRIYSSLFKNVWLWSEFYGKNDLGGSDTGIDLVALTHNGEYWAIQCKFYDKKTTLDKPAVDSFLATSSRKFKNDRLETTTFSRRLWISTTNKWGPNAEEAIRNQNPEVTRINISQLESSNVDWEKIEQGLYGKDALLKEKKTPQPHQEIAINAANEYFKTQDRGKLIMACGTGKTFTSLKIAEKETNSQGLVLFLVPSIALLGQSLREWTSEADKTIFPICICSDANVSKKRTKNEDTDGFSVIDLALPASTHVPDIIKQFEFAKQNTEKGMTVVFSTYQSIEVIAKAQAELLKNSNFEGEGAIFDLIICDEAHRTTGITLANEDSSAFVKVHDNEIIKAKKRMYMTATPRLYGENAISKANRYEAVLCSMDDDKIYGNEIYRMGFGDAVAQNLLCDYKVLILTVSENDMSESLQNAVYDGYEIKADDKLKLVGCVNALSKHISDNHEEHIKQTDPNMMRRAVAFCGRIENDTSPKAKKIIASKSVEKFFNQKLAEAQNENATAETRESTVKVSAKHIDGTMSAPERDGIISWLKETPKDEQECRILTNVRCLSEGVDVPSLDAVIFLSPRESKIDVVQSVGRVMRKSDETGKKYGYIIIPVVIPVNVEPDQALDDNERYKIIWEVLNALRAHDEKFEAQINQIELNNQQSDKIRIVSISNENNTTPNGENEVSSNAEAKEQRQLNLNLPSIQTAIYARMVQKVGNKRYWEQWAKDVAIIAERHVERINRLIAQDGEHKQTFTEFLTGLQRNINPAISQNDAVEMLSQHLITKPVFDALFSDYSFVKNNPVSVAMQTMLEVLENQALEKETEILAKFYESVKTRATGLNNAAAKQKIIVELYDKFFKTAFPKMVEKLGIVYTPVEVVDFIVNSVDVLLKKEFDRNISDENIHILDPFTGTGTFMTRLLQNKLIKPEDLHRKYTKELHANEIVLLAYYIAAINIENAYFELQKNTEYQAFNGIVLTDTFQLGENDNTDKLFSDKLQQNSERVIAQKKAPLRIIMGNPPYSVGQKSANDNAQNQEYKELDKRIAKSYAKKSQATSLKALYDSYIKAFRWSSDRLDKEGGIIAFVSNAGWLDGNGMDGFRECLEKEFSAIYVFNLRGNARTSGELRRRESGNVFGSGSQTPITITFLVKNPNSLTEKATIHYYDIGDYRNREQKLELIKKFKSIDSIEWQILQPNEHADWINQRNEGFDSFITIEPEKKFDVKSKTFFVTFALGIVTARDAWLYNYSLKQLENNTKNTIEFYNNEVERFQKAKIITPNLDIIKFVNNDNKQISWTRTLRNNAEKNKKYIHNSNYIRRGFYRPFCKLNLYFNKDLVNDMAVMPQLFPFDDTKNLIICLSCVGANKGLSVLITDIIADLHFVGDTQCFPLYYYEEVEILNPTLFEGGKTHEWVRRDGVSNFILDLAQKAYGNSVSKEDIFYYVYGALHSESYREKYANDLKKMLPRLLLVEESKDFWAFSKAGRKLAELHLNYETSEFAKDVVTVFSTANTPNYIVEKMRFGKKESVTDKSVIQYNSQITIENIPLEAYNYVVNGKSAIDWIMERYQMSMHKESGIKNNPNDWAVEVGNEKYIYELLLRVIRVSVETVEIVKVLPVI